MNMDSVNKWLMLVANIGVIAGIVFLAVEVSQNTKVAQSSARQESLNAELWLLEKGFEYPGIFGNNTTEIDIPNLSEDELFQAQVYYLAYFRVRENLWLQYDNGVLDEATWNSYRSTFVYEIGQEPGLKEFWTAVTSNFFTPAFVEDINGELFE